MENKDIKITYEDFDEADCELSKEEREFLLSEENREEGENTQNIRTKTIYYISDKNGKVSRSTAYEQIGYA